jgi:hypothetical protein
MTQAPPRGREEVLRPEGDQPEWQLVYDEFRKHSPGDVISCQRLPEVPGREGIRRHGTGSGTGTAGPAARTS